MKTTRFIKPVLIAVCLIGMTGCSTKGQTLSMAETKPWHLTKVKAWERGTLSRDDMQLVTDDMDLSIDDHIYFSKEASTGGSGIQGGGCGCN